MMKKNKMNSRGGRRAGATSGTEKLFKLVTVLMAVILVIMILLALWRIHDAYDPYISDPNEMYFTLKGNDYVYAYGDMMSNIALGATAEKDSEYTESYAVADYFNSAMMTRIYQRASELAEDKGVAKSFADRARAYEARMAEDRALMEDLTFKADEIDEALG